MAVYVDNARIKFGRMKMSHMIADSETELHDMATAIGLRRAWYQGRASFPHYDVSMSVREKAIGRGAIECDPRELVSCIRRIRGLIRSGQWAAA